MSLSGIVDTEAGTVSGLVQIGEEELSFEAARDGTGFSAASCAVCHQGVEGWPLAAWHEGERWEPANCLDCHQLVGAKP
jgi:hypothetical protein